MNRVTNCLLNGKGFCFSRKNKFRFSRILCKSYSATTFTNKKKIKDSHEIDVKENDQNEYTRYIQNNDFEVKKDVVSDLDVDNSIKGELECNASGFVMKNSHRSNVSFSRAVEIFQMLSNQKTRSREYLEIAVNSISSHSSPISLKNCTDILYSCARLNYKNKDFLDKIADSIITKKLELSGGYYVASMLHSIGVLQYRNSELIEILVKMVLDKKNYNTEYLVKALTTLAVLNFSSPYVTVIYNNLINLGDIDFTDTKGYLDFIWASVLLNKFPVEHIAKILSEQYYDHIKLLNGKGQNFKILNVNGAASTLIKDYEGPLLKKKYCNYQKTNSKHQFLNLVLDTLSHLYSGANNVGTYVDTGSGFYIDLELALDLKNKVVLSKSKNGASKIAVLLLEYNDYCLDYEKSITGLMNFKIRLLQAQGYKTVIVPYFEFTRHMKLGEKIEYLQKKIGDCFE